MLETYNKCGDKTLREAGFVSFKTMTIEEKEDFQIFENFEDGATFVKIAL